MTVPKALGRAPAAAGHGEAAVIGSRIREIDAIRMVRPSVVLPRTCTEPRSQILPQMRREAIVSPENELRLLRTSEQTRHGKQFSLSATPLAPARHGTASVGLDDPI